MNWFFTFLKHQLFTTLPYPDGDFTGQTIIVTGSNTSLGREAARHLVRLNAARVILAVRTVSKGDAARANIIQSTGADPNTVEVWQLDLSHPKSVVAFGQRVQTLDRLDAVIQNAGMMTEQWRMIEGNESVIMTNLIGAVLLGLETLPKLKESARRFQTRGKLSFVGSDTHYIARFKEQYVQDRKLFDVLNDQKASHLGDRYPVSKVLLLHAVRLLAQAHPITPDSNVIINNISPGACESDIFRDEASIAFKVVIAVLSKLLLRTTEEGSRTLVHAVNPDLGPETHGKFLWDCEIYPFGSNIESVQGQKTQQRLQEELFDLLERIHPGVTNAE